MRGLCHPSIVRKMCHQVNYVEAIVLIWLLSFPSPRTISVPFVKNPVFPTIYRKLWGRTDEVMIFQRYKRKFKWKQLCPGLNSLTISFDNNVYVKRTCVYVSVFVCVCVPMHSHARVCLYARGDIPGVHRGNKNIKAKNAVKICALINFFGQNTNQAGVCLGHGFR